MKIGIEQAFKIMGVDVQDPTRHEFYGRIAIQPTIEMGGHDAHVGVGVIVGGNLPKCKDHRLLCGRFIFIPDSISEDTERRFIGSGLSGLATSNGGLHPEGYSKQIFSKETAD